MLAILLLSFGSGLPFNLTSSTLQAWLADVSVDIKTIGIFSLVGVPYITKFLWAPLLDRYLPPFLGRRRGWILIFQLLLAVAIAAMGFSHPETNPWGMGALALVVTFLSASQDIVMNAYQVDTIPPSERALAAGAAAFGYRTAAMLAGAVLIAIAAATGWQLAYMLVALLMLVSALATLWAPEPRVPGTPPRTLFDAVWKPLSDLMSRPGFWGFLFMILLYKFGDAFALSLYSAFMLKGVGITLPQLATAKLDMTISTMAGVALGGWIYLRFGMFRSLLVLGIAQALTNLMYSWLAVVGKVYWLVLLATTVDTLVGGMGQAAFVAFLVSLCTVDFSATQYAILSALAVVPRVVMSSAAGYVVSAIGWPRFFVVTCATALPGIVLLVLLRRQLNALAARDVATRR